MLLPGEDRGARNERRGYQGAVIGIKAFWSLKCRTLAGPKTAFGRNGCNLDHQRMAARCRLIKSWESKMDIPVWREELHRRCPPLRFDSLPISKGRVP